MTRTVDRPVPSRDAKAGDAGATSAQAQADLESGRRLFAQSCRFVAGVAELDQLPPFSLPEVGFAGRSNVGKSSLLNALTGRRSLARISNTPGRTRQLNFFELGGRLMLVDLPGYGYAKAPKTEIRRWTRLTRDYLRGRPSLRRVCLLIDARRGVGEGDLQVMHELDAAAVSYQLVLTKTDKTDAETLALREREVAALHSRHVALHPDLLATSARRDEGLAALRAGLAALASSERDG